MKIIVSVGDADVEFAEVRDVQAMVKGGDLYVVRRRETYQDIVRGESIPEFLR